MMKSEMSAVLGSLLLATSLQAQVAPAPPSTMRFQWYINDQEIGKGNYKYEEVGGVTKPMIVLPEDAKLRVTEHGDEVTAKNGQNVPGVGTVNQQYQAQWFTNKEGGEPTQVPGTEPTLNPPVSEPGNYEITNGGFRGGGDASGGTPEGGGAAGGGTPAGGGLAGGGTPAGGGGVEGGTPTGGGEANGGTPAGGGNANGGTPVAGGNANGSTVAAGGNANGNNQNAGGNAPPGTNKAGPTVEKAAIKVYDMTPPNVLFHIKDPRIEGQNYAFTLENPIHAPPESKTAEVGNEGPNFVPDVMRTEIPPVKIDPPRKEAAQYEKPYDPFNPPYPANTLKVSYGQGLYLPRGVRVGYSFNFEELKKIWPTAVNQTEDNGKVVSRSVTLVTENVPPTAFTHEPDISGNPSGYVVFRQANVDPQSQARYSLKYKVTDEFGNWTEATVPVKVFDLKLDLMKLEGHEKKGD